MPVLGRIQVAIGEHRLLVFGILVALVVALLILVTYQLIRSRKKAAPAVAPTPPPPPRPPRAPRPKPGQRRSALARFEGGLRRDYRRSILTFARFIVMGAAASGKSTLIDAYSDWKLHTREFVSSQPDDPDLP